MTTSLVLSLIALLLALCAFVFAVFVACQHRWGRQPEGKIPEAKK